jgi:hypothetical protein
VDLEDRLKRCEGRRGKQASREDKPAEGTPNA